jgi:hypothetical protein
MFVLHSNLPGFVERTAGATVEQIAKLPFLYDGFARDILNGNRAMYRIVPNGWFYHEGPVTKKEVAGIRWALENGGDRDETTFTFMNAVYVNCVLDDGTVDLSRMDTHVPSMRNGFNAKKIASAVGFQYHSELKERYPYSRENKQIENVDEFIARFFTPFINADETPSRKRPNTQPKAPSPQQTKKAKKEKKVEDVVPTTPLMESTLTASQHAFMEGLNLENSPVQPVQQATTTTTRTNDISASQESNHSLDWGWNGPAFDDEPIITPGTPGASTMKEQVIPATPEATQVVPATPEATQVIPATQLVEEDEMEVEEPPKPWEVFLERFKAKYHSLQPAFFPDKFVGPCRRATRSHPTYESPAANSKAYDIETEVVFLDQHNIERYWLIMVNKESILE